MKNKSRSFLVLGVLLLVTAAFLWNAPAGADGEVAVVVNPANPISTLSPADLRKIFLGEKSTWPNGKHVLLVMAAPGSPEREAVLKNVYKMSESDYSKYFLQAAFTGQVAAPPRDASSAAEVKQLVAGNPGAIGYVGQQDVGDSVKVVCKIP
jgi:ABC-type phosphate transport system substrate-binding protein